jgi:homoserine kinase type II
MLDLATIQSAWHLPPILSTCIPETGTIHQTFLLSTASTTYVLRAYHYPPEQRWHIEYEHDLIRYAHKQGLPALIPLPLVATGESIFSQHNRFYALFPFAPGYQAQHGQLSSSEIAALGSFLAQTHIALQPYPKDRVYQRTFSVDSAATLTRIARIEAVISKKSALTSIDTNVLKCLAQQRTWIEDHPAANGLLDLSGLEHQVIHGDYQHTNIFFTSYSDLSVRVSAIIDWDQAYVAPRAWEIVRTLDYACNLEPSLCSIFLANYRSLLPISTEDLQQAAIIYGLKRAYDTWIYEALYLEGNERVTIFISDEFVPFIDRWQKLSWE